MSNPYDGWSKVALDAERARIDRERAKLADSESLRVALQWVYGLGVGALILWALVK